MKKSSKISPKIILSGGGTGGHIYPAIAIANEIKTRFPQADILFVGAKNKMEMEKVPKAGFPIQGLWISGINRSRIFSNFSLPFQIISGLWKSKKIIQNFKPDIAIGTGGFASGPLLYVAAQKNIPVLIQEQNSFPGITNKILKNKAFAICTAYDGMQQYFPKDKIHLTGNPIRSELFTNLPNHQQAKEKLGFDPNKPLILSVGGSLGSRTLNNSWHKGLQKLIDHDIQLLWQTGQLEWNKINAEVNSKGKLIQAVAFIYEMNLAYAAADIIVSRAGAMAISELTLIAKPTILIPYPFAAEDHQTKNAESLVKKQAAKMISDNEAPNYLVDQAINLTQNINEQKSLIENIQKLAKPNAAQNIVDLIEKKLNEH